MVFQFALINILGKFNVNINFEVFELHSNFFSLSELVKDGENGHMFENSEELCEQIITWFKDFPSNTEQNKIASQFRNNLKTFQQVRWDSNWNSRAKPLFD